MKPGTGQMLKPGTGQTGTRETGDRSNVAPSGSREEGGTG
jgi:hypothetical protein